MAGLRRKYARDLFGRIAPFLIIFAAVYVSTSVIFYLLEGRSISLFLSFYWAITTLSTVGYGDIVPNNTYARIDAMAAMFIQIFLLGYLISVIATTVTTEQQKRSLGLLGTDLKDHVVVLGYSAVARSAIRELLAQDQKVAVVVEAQEDVPNVRTLASEARLYVTYGLPGEREILLRANLPSAHSVIVCTTDDATNMIAALNARAVAPHIRVVVSISRPELRDTLRAAGVTFVASPADMGGRLCAAAAFEPDVADALDDLTQGDVRADVQEYQITESTPISRMRYGDAERKIREVSGCLLIGYARPDGAGEYSANINPETSIDLRPGDALILIGTIPNVHRFRQWYGIDQGR